MQWFPNLQVTMKGVGLAIHCEGIGFDLPSILSNQPSLPDLLLSQKQFSYSRNVQIGGRTRKKHKANGAAIQ